MIRIYVTTSILMLFCFVSAANDITMVNDIQFIYDEDCFYQGDELSLEGSFAIYQWERVDPNQDLGSNSSINVVDSGTYCVTVTNDQGVSCSACVDIEVSNLFSVLINNVSVCSQNIGNGPTAIDFTTLIIAGQTDGTWTDDSSTGVDLSDITNVDFEGLPFGDYQFSYEISDFNCNLSLVYQINVEVVDCACPILMLNPLGEYCNDVILSLDDFLQNLEGEWSSNTLNITDNILDLNGFATGTYELTFDWLEIAPDCPSMFSTTIEVIGCFDAQSVLFVESDNDKVIFSWTDELQALDLSIEVLQGPEGVRDGNTYTISGLLPGEEVGIEIFVNTEGYLYDNDLIIYGQSLTTSIQESELLSDIILYPNPVQDHLYIDCSPLEYNIIATISSSNGYRVFKVKDLNHNSIDISDLPSGMYYLTLEAVDGIKKLPFVKQ